MLVSAAGYLDQSPTQLRAPRDQIQRIYSFLNYYTGHSSPAILSTFHLYCIIISENLSLLPGQTMSSTAENLEPPASDTHNPSITENPKVIVIEHGNPVQYRPPLGKILGFGSTCQIARMGPGVVIKCPRYCWWRPEEVAQNLKYIAEDAKRSFEVEKGLLQIIGPHPRIIECVAHTSFLCSMVDFF